MKDKPNKVTTVLKVIVTGEFYDDNATEETLRYAVEQDLEDVGFDVDVAMLKEQDAPILTVDDAVSTLMDKHHKRLKEQDTDKPKGYWMPYEPDKRGYTDGFTCSRCERVILSDHYCKMIDFDFCPYCGAYMDNAEGR